MRFDKLVEEVRQFGSNPWTQFAPSVDGGGWDAIMIKGVTISDHDFLALIEQFPDMPPSPVIMDELRARGMIEDHDEIVEQPEPAQPVARQSTGQLSAAEIRRNRLIEHMKRTEERGERRRRRR